MLGLTELSEDKLKQELQGSNVQDVKHILKTENVQKVPTGTLALTFNTAKLPQSIKAGYIKLNVRPYIPNPLRCFKCQAFGHKSKFCKKSEVCPKWGERAHGMLAPRISNVSTVMPITPHTLHNAQCLLKRRRSAK